MTTEVRVLKEVELLGHQFTIYGTKENPLFLLRDVATVLCDGIYRNGLVAMISKPISFEEKQKVYLNDQGIKYPLVMITKEGLFEVLSYWEYKYEKATNYLRSYIICEYGNSRAKQKLSSVSKEEHLFTDGDMVVKTKITKKRSVSPKNMRTVVLKKDTDKKESADNSVKISIPKEAVRLVKNLQDPKMSAKDYLLEAVCKLIEVMYDPETPEKNYKVKDLFPLYQMAKQRELINALQIH